MGLGAAAAEAMERARAMATAKAAERASGRMRECGEFSAGRSDGGIGGRFVDSGPRMRAYYTARAAGGKEGRWLVVGG